MKFLSQINVNTEYTLPIVDGNNGQVLTTDGQGAVYWGNVSAGATSLDGLTDVEITSPQAGQILNYSVPLGGTVPVWRNITSPYATIASPTFTGIPAAPTAPTATNTTQIATTAFVKAQGYLSSASSINDLGDVTISTVATGQILQWSGTQWVNATLSTVEYVSKVQHLVKCGVAVTKGQAVYVTSADGTNMIVGLASNATEATSSKVIGLAASTGAINDQIFVVTEGLIAGLNTSTANAGDPVWLGTGGNLIFGLVNKPVAPAHLVYLGVVTRVQSNNGEIFVNVQNGFELNELHDVLISSPSTGQLIRRDSDGLWKNWTPNYLTSLPTHNHDDLYYTESEIAGFFGGEAPIAGYNATNWDTAYGWGNHATQGYATQTYVNTAIANLVDSAPSTLDTLNELAAALGDDPNFATTVTNSIATKLPLTGGTVTGPTTFDSLLTVKGNIKFFTGSYTGDWAGIESVQIAPNQNDLVLYTADDGGTNDRIRFVSRHYSSGDTDLAIFDATQTNFLVTPKHNGATLATQTWVGANYYNTGQIEDFFSGAEAISGYNKSNWDTAYNDRITAAAVTGTSTKTLTLTQGDGGTVTATWTDYDTDNDAQVLTWTAPSKELAISNGNSITLDGLATEDYVLSQGFTTFQPWNAGTGSINYTAGKVGIGTTSPTQQLHVVGTNAGNNGVTIQNTNASGNSQVRFLNSGGTEVGAITYIGGTTSHVYHYTAAGGNLLNLVDANVGIGTTNPIYKLQVAGSAYVNGGTLYLDTNQYLRWGNSNQGIVGSNDSHVAIVSGGSTRQTIYADGHTYFPGLDLAISNVNSSHSRGNYFRGDASHFVLGTSGRLYLNYGGTDTYLTAELSFADYADNVRINKGSNWLNLRDPWNNIHLRNYISGYGVYIDSSIHYWRPHDGSSNWMTLSSTGLGLGVAPSYKLDVAGAVRLTGSLVFDDLTSNLIQHRAGNDVNTLVTVGHGGFDHNGYLRIGGADVATRAWVQAQGYLTSDTDAQTLSYDQGAKQITISNGNSITLDNLATEDYVLSQGFTTFQPWNSGTGSINYTAGKVGINTSSPSEKLHVVGAAIFDGGAGDSSTDSVLYVTKSNSNDWGLYVNASGVDYGMYVRISPSAGYAFGIHNGTTWTTRITGDGRIHLNNKDTIASYDSWLRLNQSGEYTSGVYTPAGLRNDGAFDNYGGIYGYNTIRGRKAQTNNNYTTAALWTESYDNTTTGIAFHISGNVGKFLEMRTDGVLYWENAKVWTAGNDGAASGLDADLLDGQHGSYYQPASTAITTSNIGSQNVNYAEYTNRTYRGIIEDTRSAQRTPNGYDDYRVSWEFTDQITGIPDWHSVMTMQGWHDGYAAWQIIGPSSTTAHENWYLRSGNTTTWNTLRRIWHNGDFSSTNISNWNAAYNDRITAVAVSGTGTKTLTLTQQDGGTLTATWTDYDTDNDAQTLSWDQGQTLLSISGGNDVTLTGLATEDYVNSQGFVTSSGTVAGVVRTVTGTNSAELVRGNMGDNDQARILVGATASNAGYLEIATADDGTEPIYVRQYTGVFSSLTRTATLLDGSGNTTFPGSLTIGGTFTENSSIRFKENIQPLEPALAKVEQLNPVTYTKITSQEEEIGLIAEEVAELFPEVVTYNESGQPQGIQYQRLSVILLKAVQELTERVNKLENK